MSNKLHVGNLNFDTSEDALHSLFQEHGEITSCRIIKNRDTGRGKGFGFVEFANAESAQNAMDALNGTELDSREIRISEARPQEKREGGGGRGGYGGGRGRGGGGRGGYGGGGRGGRDRN